MIKEEYDIDSHGYYIYSDSKKLVHRHIAKKYVWAKDRKKYPLEFYDYQVHHINKIKLDNRPENLELLPRAEHEKSHGIIRREKLEITYMKVLALGILAIFGADWLANKWEATGLQKALLFSSIFITALAIALLLSLEDKNKRYV